MCVSDDKKLAYIYPYFHHIAEDNQTIPIATLDEDDGINSDECVDTKKINKETYENLNIYLFDPYINKIREFFQKHLPYVIEKEIEIEREREESNTPMTVRQEMIDDDRLKKLLRNIENENEKWREQVLIQDSIKWEIKITDDDISPEEISYISGVIEKSKTTILKFEEEFSTKLPLPNYTSFKLCDKWNLDIIDNKESLLKYGVVLLSFAIKEHKLDLIEIIYNKCITHFKEDLKNNRMFLSIITTTIPLFNEYYPEYILKYSLETNMKYINENVQKQLLITSIILGFIHLSFEVRQIIYDPLKWIYDFWNLFASAYNQIFENGTMDSNPTMIQPPNEKTNMFADFKTALFAMYQFLTGDSSALSNWSYINNQSLVILIVLFSLLIVVYLMNLFIGLLNMAIDKDNNRVSYLIQKAEILAEIELFYLLSHQRRWEAWFPEVIYYYANADKTREEIKKLINENQWNTNEFPELKNDLLKKFNIHHNPVNDTDLRDLLEKIQSNTSTLGSKNGFVQDKWTQTEEI
ncbi:hypothetical protein C1645_803303 [Glomus cerebriforme]|uniref:Ion transport domain-containing protein n=1 Tax=Glomus cerebriforme TaxID=658196 RepID=A0A397TEW8_9GLOM|nr:hypothetical protein C1645_803303 [Glomus cerebriforme]